MNKENETVTLLSSSQKKNTSIVEIDRRKIAVCSKKISRFDL